MSRDEIIAFIRRNGPALPVQVAKVLNTNSLMASALLSELKSNGDIKLSAVKVGGSPLYYIEGQESQLMKYSDKLHEKEQEAYNSLRKELILRDKDQPPHIRVALRAIKDFSKQIVVRTQNGEEVFWKWFMLSNEDAEKKVKEILLGKSSEEQANKEKDVSYSQTQDHSQGREQPQQSEASQTKKPPENEQKQRIEPLSPPSQQEQTKDDTESEPEAKEIEPKKHQEEQKSESVEKENVEENKSQPERTDDEFLNKLNRFFSRKEIDVHKTTVIRKNTEAEFFLAIPSSVGKLTYYCKAKNKKRINDSDLAAAYVQGEVNKLPVLFLITGDLTKKAKQMLGSQFKNVRVAKV